MSDDEGCVHGPPPRQLTLLFVPRLKAHEDVNAGLRSTPPSELLCFGSHARGKVQTLLAAGPKRARPSSLQNPQPMSSKPSCRMTLVRSENTIGQLRPCGWWHGYRVYCVQNKLIV